MSDTFSSIKDKLLSFSDDQRVERLNQCMEIQLALDECLRLSERSLQKNALKENQEDGSKKRWSNKIWSKTTQDESKEDKNKDEYDDHPKARLEDSRSGMKMSRFYGWGLVNSRAQAAITEMREQGGTWNSLRPTSNTSTSNSLETTETEYFNDVSSEESTAFKEFPSNDPDKSSSLSSCCTRETHALWGCRAIALGCAPELVKLKRCFEDKLGTTNPPSMHYNDSNGETLSLSCCGLEQKVVGDCVLRNWNELNKRIEKRKNK